MALSVYSTVSRSKATKEKSKNFAKIVRRCRLLAVTFWHFVNNEWYYDSSNALASHALLSGEEQRMFRVDPTGMSWPQVCWFMLTYADLC
jgi:hypothetical protein